MASPTRRRLTFDEVAALVDGSLGRVVAGHDLNGGGFAAIGGTAPAVRVPLEHPAHQAAGPVVLVGEDQDAH